LFCVFCINTDNRTLIRSHCVGEDSAGGSRRGLGEPVRCGEAARSWGASTAGGFPSVGVWRWFPPGATAVRPQAVRFAHTPKG
jgi:hypothetical protein